LNEKGLIGIFRTMQALENMIAWFVQEFKYFSGQISSACIRSGVFGGAKRAAKHPKYSQLRR
jgi:hypothetical protein